MSTAHNAPWPRPLAEAARTLAFLGEVLIALWRWVRGRGGPTGRDVLHQLDQSGPRSLPIVGLSCALIGLMLAYMGGAQLARIGAQQHLAQVVSVVLPRLHPPT